MARRLYEIVEPFKLRAGLDAQRGVRVIHMVSDVTLNPKTAVADMIATPLPSPSGDAQDCVDGSSLAIGEPWPLATAMSVPSDSVRVRNYDVEAIPGNPLELLIAVEYGEPITVSFGGAINLEQVDAFFAKRTIPIQTYKKLLSGVGGGPDIYGKAQVYTYRRPGFRVVIQRTAGPIGSPGGPLLPTLAASVGKFYTLEGSGLGFDPGTVFFKEDVEVRRVSATQAIVRHHFYTEFPSLTFVPGGDAAFATIPAIPAFASPLDALPITGGPPVYTMALDTAFQAAPTSFNP